MAHAKSIRALVVNPGTEQAEYVRWLLKHPGFEVVIANSGEDALLKCTQQPVDLVVLDAEMPGLDGYAVATELRHASRAALRSIPIVMLVDDIDVADKLAGLKAGVTEFFSRPLDTDTFVDGLQLLLTKEMPPLSPELVDTSRKAFTIAVFGTKGGVGKTMISVNMALALQHALRAAGRTAIMDADFFFGDVGVHLNLPTTKSIVDLLPQVDTLDEYAEEALVAHPSGLSVLLSPYYPEEAERIEPDHVRHIVAWLAERFHFVVVDCPPAYDERVLIVLEEADAILLIVTPEIGPLKNMSLFLDLAHKLGIASEKIYVVLNRSDSNVGIEMNTIERTIRHRVSFRVASGGRPVVLNVNRGTPILLKQPDHPVSRQIIKIAEFFVQRAKQYR